MRHIPLLLPLLSLAATAPTLQAGSWTIASAPTGATLDGRRLDDLPYTPPPGPGTICLSPAEAADPARWLARDLAQGCTFTTRSLAQGRIVLEGTCRPQAPGLAGGTVRVTGRWSPTSYDLRFATTNPSENGVMGFTGTLTGRRSGDCVSEPRPAPRP